MKTEIFERKFIEIVENVENTYYGSIITQLNLALLAQEFFLTNTFPNDQIVKICSEIEYKNLNLEAQDEAVGEFLTNLANFGREISILKDFGESYILSLLNNLKRLHSKNILFTECNC